jgi:hypothetical protein
MFPEHKGFDVRGWNGKDFRNSPPEATRVVSVKANQFFASD